MKKKILIFGCEGQLGSDLCPVFKNDYKLLPVTHKMVDVTVDRAVTKIILSVAPDVIINATAYNKVEQAEEEIGQAFALNAFAPCYMAKAAAKVSAVMVHVSTDYVFNGSKKYFVENDVPNPLNVYGVSKLTGEQLIKVSCPQHYIIRTSGLFGTKQSSQKLNFVDQMVTLAKAEKRPTVVDDLITSLTFSADLAGKIKQLVEKAAPFGTYHITNSGSSSWYGFAEKIMEIMGTGIKPQAIKYASGKIVRPKFSVLENYALKAAGIEPMPPWEDALKRYLQLKYKI